MLVICCLSTVCLVGLTHIGEASVSRARADAVADVVALAGVGYGQLGAQQVAEASKAGLLRFDQTGPSAVQVTVQLGGVRSPLNGSIIPNLQSMPRVMEPQSPKRIGQRSVCCENSSRMPFPSMGSKEKKRQHVSAVLDVAG